MSVITHLPNFPLQPLPPAAKQRSLYIVRNLSACSTWPDSDKRLEHYEMSDSSGSSTKVAFICRGCDQDEWISKKALQDDSVDGCPVQYLEMRYRRQTRCQICGIIKGVDEALSNLLSHFPFLETEGMAAADNMEEWEIDGLIKPYKTEEERGNGGESDGMTVEERQAMTDKIVKSFVKTAGQGITEEEAFAEEEPSEDSDESTVDDTIDEAMRAFGVDWETKTLGEDSELDSDRKEAV